MIKPEFASVEEYAEYLLDEERESFTFAEVSELAKLTNDRVAGFRPNTSWVIGELESYGLKYLARPKVRTMRTFSANSHDRWTGPGS